MLEPVPRCLLSLTQAFAVQEMKVPLQFLPPWVPIAPETRVEFEDEYAIEIGKEHPLYGAPVRAIARRIDSDDVLFELLRCLCDYVVVRLTWSGQEEEDHRLPKFELFLDHEVMDKCIRPAHEKYKD